MVPSRHVSRYLLKLQNGLVDVVQRFVAIDFGCNVNTASFHSVQVIVYTS